MAQLTGRHVRRGRLLAVVAAGWMLCSIAAAADRSGDNLRPIVDCMKRGSFSLIDQATKRWPADEDHRMVTTAAGTRRVSVADGYLVVLESGPETPFINLKIERSAPGSFAEDRAAVRAQMQMFSDRLGPSDKRLQVSEHDGIEIMALDEPTTAVSGTIGF